ncbi:hypothetical protein [Maricaulis sp. CAU 1757]
MQISFIRLLVIALAALGVVAGSTGALAQVTGENATFIRFDGGSFERINQPRTWQEFGQGNPAPRFTWIETHRDDWSVYLRDDSRNMQMQIDLHTGWVRLAWPGQPMSDHYRITESDARVNGRMAVEVHHDGGVFTMDGNTDWVEINSQGQRTYRFRETHRDQWSVYLRDDSRDMDMQIDLHRNWIRLGWPGHDMADQYRITRAY